MAHRLLCVLAGLLAGLLASTAAAQDAAPHSPEGRVDSLFARYDNTRTPGAAVGVVRDGALVFARGYGLAELPHGLAFTPQTVSDLGSVSKQFTALALLLLADAGKLSLDDDVRRHLPEVPDFGAPVTLRHLLQHTGGYREVYSTLGLEGWRDGDAVRQEDALRIVRAQPELQAPPGTAHVYNNTGYMLLADVVARVTGEPFAAWMAANVFAPLGMHRTTIMARPGQVIPHAADAYGPDGAGGFVQIFDNSSVQGAGGVYSTVEDMARWLRNLGAGTLGGPGLPARLAERTVLTAGDTLDYGLGIVVDTHRGLRRLHHSGSSAGYRSRLIYYPELDAGVIVLANHAGFDASIPFAVAEAFFADFTDPPAPEPAATDDPKPMPPDLSADALAAYAGRYVSEELGTIYTVRLAGDSLVVASRRIGPVPLRPHAADAFHGHYPITEVRFTRDRHGRITGFSISNGRTQGVRFEKLP